MMMKNQRNGGQPSGRRLRKDVDGPIDHGTHRSRDFDLICYESSKYILFF